MEIDDQKGHLSSSESVLSPVEANVRSGNVGDPKEISLKDLILKLREWYLYLSHKWLIILLAGLIGAILGFTYAYLKKPIYIATTTFVLETGEGGGGAGLGQYSGLASMVGIDLGGGGGGIFQGDNIMELYKSRTMIEKALLSGTDNENLIERYFEYNNIREGWSKKPELANIKFDRKSGDFNRIQDSILGETVKDINANYLSVTKPDKKLSIIKVEVRSKDEAFAKTFNEQIVKNVNDFYVQTKTKKSLENVAILQQKTDSVRAVMNGAIYSAISVSDATPNINLTKQVRRAAPMQRSQFSAETNKVVLGELVKNLELSKISLRKETPLIQVIDHPIYPLEKIRFGKLKGIVLGGLMLGLITVLALVIRRLYNRILN